MNTIPFFLLMSAVFFTAIFFYRRPCRLMAKFCYRMTTDEVARKLYCYVMLLTVIFLHFCYHNAFGNDWGLMVSGLVMIALFNLSVGERIIATLAHDILIMWSLVVLTLGIAFCNHMMPMALCLSVLICFATFYPSRHILEMDRKYLSEFYYSATTANDYQSIVDCYFSNGDNGRMNSDFNSFSSNVRRIVDYIKSRWSLATGRKVTLA